MITFHDGIFHLQGKNISYLMEVDKKGNLLHRYFGKKLRDRSFAPMEQLLRPWGVNGCPAVPLDSLPQEYPAYGKADLRTPAFSVYNEDGNTVSELFYKDHRITDGKPALSGLPAVYDEDDLSRTLEIELEDPVTGLAVALLYTVFEDTDVICRSAKLSSNGKQKLTVRQAASCNVDFRRSDLDAVYLTGAWARERHITRRSPAQGKLEISNARGGSGHQVNPFVVLCEKNADEKQGEVYGFSLVYSGNHCTTVEVDQYGDTRLAMGIHPYDFSWDLSESLQTPECVLAYSAEGFGGLSRIYHDLYRSRLCRGEWRDRPRPVLINNWEGTYFDFNEEKLLAIAEKAKSVGVELFVLDDGWFGKRDNDLCSLGDWVVNREKLPSGIDGLAEKIEAMGLSFGLWFEPEMVNPDSDLYRAHPDWAICVPGREPSRSRSQLILDLSRDEVCEYVIESVCKVLGSAKISYVKWDMNRHMMDQPFLGYNHKYILGLYRVMEEITSRFPHILFESCSGGGGRFDPGILHYMPQTWTSDDSDAIERLKIQYGTSLCYPPCTMGAHVTASPNHQTGRISPLKTRADIAYAGAFGYELDITLLSEEEMQEIREQIVRYKELRHLVMTGDFYRLYSPFEQDECGWSLVSKDQNEVFIMAARGRSVPNSAAFICRAAGLKPEWTYRNTETDEVYGGDELMYMGFEITFPEGDNVTYSGIFKAE